MICVEKKSALLQDVVGLTIRMSYTEIDVISFCEQFSAIQEITYLINLLASKKFLLDFKRLLRSENVLFFLGNGQQKETSPRLKMSQCMEVLDSKIILVKSEITPKFITWMHLSVWKTVASIFLERSIK